MRKGKIFRSRLRPDPKIGGHVLAPDFWHPNGRSGWRDQAVEMNGTNQISAAEGLCAEQVRIDYGADQARIGYGVRIGYGDSRSRRGESNAKTEKLPKTRADTRRQEKAREGTETLSKPTRKGRS